MVITVVLKRIGNVLQRVCFVFHQADILCVTVLVIIEDRIPLGTNLYENIKIKQTLTEPYLIHKFNYKHKSNKEPQYVAEVHW